MYSVSKVFIRLELTINLEPVDCNKRYTNLVIELLTIDDML